MYKAKKEIKVWLVLQVHVVRKEMLDQQVSVLLILYTSYFNRAPSFLENTNFVMFKPNGFV